METTSTLTYGTLSFTHLTRREIAFLKLVCSELTYHQIAHEMRISPRTVDGYREGLFEKLGVKSRVSLALWAVKVGLVVL
jgi:DNA-binding CsgD family transcriptional regulator